MKEDREADPKKRTGEEKEMDSKVSQGWREKSDGQGACERE